MRSLTVDKPGAGQPSILAGCGTNGLTWEHHTPPGATLTLLGNGRLVARVEGEGFAAYVLDENGKKEAPSDG